MCSNKKHSHSIKCEHSHNETGSRSSDEIKEHRYNDSEGDEEAHSCSRSYIGKTHLQDEERGDCGSKYDEEHSHGVSGDKHGSEHSHGVSGDKGSEYSHGGCGHSHGGCEHSHGVSGDKHGSEQSHGGCGHSHGGCEHNHGVSGDKHGSEHSHGGCGHSHKEHKHGGCGHSHGNEKLATSLYLGGLVAFIIANIITKALYANILFLIAVVVAGYHVIFEGVMDTISNTKRWRRFTPNVHLLMSLATVGALLIGNFEEAAMLILIFAGAHFLEEYIDEKSKKEITNLFKMNPTKARLILGDGSIKEVDVKELKIGDKLQVLNGDQVAADGKIISGTASINEASINGESIPREKTVGDEVYASTINGDTAFVMEVTKEAKDTVFAKIINVVESSQKSLTKTASFIEKLEPKYVKVVLALVPVVFLVGYYVLGWSLDVSLYRTIVYLISVSPCALAASAVPATLATISNLSKRGVLVKGGKYLSTLSEVRAVSFDKTGTLTKGAAEVTNFIFQENDDEILKVVVSMEKKSNHPLAKAVLRKFSEIETFDLEVENKVGTGLFATYLEDEYVIAKPSFFGNVEKSFKKLEENFAKEGKTVVFVGKNSLVIGLLAFMDLPNKEAQVAIEYFKKQGIHTTMITGDLPLTAEAVGEMVGIDEVRANVLPEEKAKIIKEQKEKYKTTMMLGDGVNDAPALTLADVGVAMGEGTDVAMEVADVVLMKNSLSKLTYAHKLSKKMLKITYQNIIFAMLVVLSLVVLNFTGKMDITFGVVLHEGSTILVILNALRLLKEIK